MNRFKKKKTTFNLIIFYHSIIIMVELASWHSIPTDVQAGILKDPITSIDIPI